MADDLSLLLRIRGDASGAKNAANETRTAIAQLRTSLQSAQGSFQAIGGPLTGFSGQLGNASSLLSVLQTEAATTGGALAGMAGPIGIAVAAFAALATGAITLTKQFIDLTISTAEWEGKLQDLSEQTGVSVETLSALEAVAETTGGSIEGVAQSLVLFQRNLAEAAGNSTTKAGEQFEKLGISTRDTEQALRDAFRALSAMPEGFRQTNAAAELFGARGGKQVLAILKSTHGDIDVTIEKLRDLDQLITTDVARTADGLNDQIRSTQRQFRGLQAQIVNESMPQIIKALEQLSKILRENRETFILLGQAIGYFVQGNLRLVAPAVEIASLAFRGHLRALAPVIEAYDRFAAVLQIVSGNLPSVDPNAIPAVGAPPVVSFGGAATLGGGITRKKGAKTKVDNTARDAFRAETEATKDAIAERESAYRDETARLKGQYDQRLIDFNSHIAALVKANKDRFDATSALIKKEQDELESANTRKLIKGDEYTKRASELQKAAAKAATDFNVEAAKLETESYQHRLELQRQFDAQRGELRDQKTADEISDLTRLRDIAIEDAALAIDNETKRAKAILQIEVEYNDKVKTLRLQQLERSKEAIYAEVRLIAERLAEVQKISIAEAMASKVVQDALAERAVEIETIENKRKRIIKEASDANIDAYRKEAQALRELQAQSVSDLAATAAGGASGGLEQLSTWEVALRSIMKLMEEFRASVSANVVSAFESMRGAAESAIAGWLVYGGSLKKALAQAVAAELAAVSARAMVQAAIHLAYSLGSLAFGDFAGAARHALAAAKFGAIAALTGVAARGLATAGGSFQQAAQNSGAVSRGSGSSFGSSPSPRKDPGVTDVDRRALPAVHVSVSLHGDIATDALTTRVRNAVVSELDLNDGRLTEMIQDAAKRGR